MKDIGVNGKLAAVLLIVAGYIIYYSFFFPALVIEQQEQFWNQRVTKQYGIEINTDDVSAGNSSQHCDLALTTTIPKHMIDFQKSKIIISVLNQNNNNQSCKGYVLLVGSLVGNDRERLIRVPAFRILSEDKDPVFFSHNILIPYDLNLYESLSVPVEVQIPTRDAREVEFVFYQRDGDLLDDNHSEDPDNLLYWGGAPSCGADDAESAQSENKNLSSYRICSTIDDEGVFRRSLVENLLLPPWSNGILPVLIIAVIWLVENSAPKALKSFVKSEDINWSWVYTAFFSAFLLWLFYFGFTSSLFYEKTSESAGNSGETISTPWIIFLICLSIVVIAIMIPRLLNLSGNLVAKYDQDSELNLSKYLEDIKKRYEK